MYPKDLKYTSEHEWVRIEDNKATMGITDYAQQELGDVVFVELPEVGAEVAAGDPFAVVESVKAVSDIYAPVSGTVIEVNRELEDSPELINKDPYEKGWIAVIEVSEEEEMDHLMDHLMDAAEYEQYIRDL